MVIYKKFSYSLFFLLLACTSMLTSCKDDDNIAEPINASAAPVIEAIRSTNANVPDSTFTKATLGTTIVIVGKNLAATRRVYFNNVEAPFNPAFATDRNLIITIPNDVPTAGTAANLANELRIENNIGETIYVFEVLDPAPTITALGNEYVKADQRLTIFGQYFYQVESVVFPDGTEDGIEVTSGLTVAQDGRSLSVTVPAGVVPSEGDVRVVTKSGSSGANRRTKLFNNAGVILNWDVQNAQGEYTGFGWGLDPSKVVGTNILPGLTPIEGKYGVVNQAVPASWGWNNDKVISMSNWATNRLIPAEDASRYAPTQPIGNFDLKMEIAAMGGSLEGLELLVFIDNTSAGAVQKSVPIADFVRSNDGMWYTLSVNLGELAAGTQRLSTYSNLNPNEIRLVIQNPTSSDITARLAFDNFRIENMVVRD